jgi:hypothetical protein
MDSHRIWICELRVPGEGCAMLTGLQQVEQLVQRDDAY